MAVGLSTLLDYQRLAMLVAAVEDTRTVPGDVVEFGSYRGGSAAVLGQALANDSKRLHLFDSFQGLPDPTAHDNYHHKGDFSDTTADLVARGLSALSIPAELHVGYFSETLTQMPRMQIALAHVDVDLYESVKACLEFCVPQMSPGGILVIDDYGEPTCHGARKAADEFFSRRPEKPELLSRPAYGVRIGDANGGLFQRLRRRAGWLSALPIVGEALYARSEAR